VIKGAGTNQRSRWLRVPELVQARGLSPERLRQLRARWHRALVLAGLVGVAVGLATAGFEWLTARVLLNHVLKLPEAALVVLPAGGLLAAGVLLQRIGRTTPAISDDYLRAYHERPRDTSRRSVGSRIAASVLTLGSGVAMGFEGPAIFLGSTIGSWVQQRFRRAFSDQDRHVLLVAGAAAGVAAIFKAPAAGSSRLLARRGSTRATCSARWVSGLPAASARASSPMRSASPSDGTARTPWHRP
jgi:H+/Cl- antiporter ClcA